VLLQEELQIAAGSKRSLKQTVARQAANSKRHKQSERDLTAQLGQARRELQEQEQWLDSAPKRSKPTPVHPGNGSIPPNGR
jgi:hypothetical protein